MGDKQVNQVSTPGHFLNYHTMKVIKDPMHTLEPRKKPSYFPLYWLLRYAQFL